MKSELVKCLESIAADDRYGTAARLAIEEVQRLESERTVMAARIVRIFNAYAEDCPFCGGTVSHEDGGEDFDTNVCTFEMDGVYRVCDCDDCPILRDEVWP